MKTKSIAFFLTGIFTAMMSSANTNFLDRNFIEVEGNVVWLNTADSRMRDTCLTNVFHSLTTNSFVMTDPSERVTRHEIECQGVRFPFEGDDRTRFWVDYYAASVPSFDKNPRGQVALMLALNDSPRSMMPPWFRQYTEGPGNICLIFMRADVTKPMNEVLFCRNNVAVRVRSFFGDDCLSFARLLDACILATPAKEAAAPPAKGNGTTK